jgi:hypothetical protein
MTDWVDGILARKSTAQDDGLRAHPPNPPSMGEF